MATNDWTMKLAVAVRCGYPHAIRPSLLCTRYGGTTSGELPSPSTKFCQGALVGYGASRLEPHSDEGGGTTVVVRVGKATVMSMRIGWER